VHGSLSLHEGVLWVGRHEKTAHVAAFDLDGRALGRKFSFRNDEPGSAAVSGLVVDQDHRIWVADTPSGRLLGFTLFGSQVAALGGGDAGEDAAKVLTEPVDVALFGEPEENLLLVASGGRRRHAVRLVTPAGELVQSLRPLGDPRGKFAGVRGVTSSERLIFVSEAGAERVQVFRDGDFHFAFRVVVPGFGRRAVATAALGDGRLVVAVTGESDKEESGLLLFNESGHFLEVLARPGRGDGEICQPEGLAVLDEGRDRDSRLFAIDCDGERVQVFNLEGDCYGAFENLTG